MRKNRVRKSTLDTKITVRLDPSQLQKLERFADGEGITVSFMVRHLVRRFLEEKDRSMPMQFGAVQTFSSPMDDWDDD
ncbi:MAG: hypothetical protein SCI25_12390 [Desulfuromonadales bacterium]|nr:hypothetical protein [Desulfuromonadales bacterium]MDW7758242.1 hypothetical protein [Desulfuromonadales bacterium]